MAETVQSVLFFGRSLAKQTKLSRQNLFTISSSFSTIPAGYFKLTLLSFILINFLTTTFYKVVKLFKSENIRNRREIADIPKELEII